MNAFVFKYNTNDLYRRVVNAIKEQMGLEGRALEIEADRMYDRLNNR